MKLFPTTRTISQHCPVDFFQSKPARKTKGHADEPRWEPISALHHIAVPAWHATAQTSLLCDGHSTASLEAIPGRSLVSEAGDVSQHPRWQAQKGVQARRGMDCVKNLTCRSRVPPEVGGVWEAPCAAQRAFGPGAPCLASAICTKFTGEDKDSGLGGGSLAMGSQPRPSQVFGLVRKKISRVDYVCHFQRTREKRQCLQALCTNIFGSEIQAAMKGTQRYKAPFTPCHHPSLSTPHLQSSLHVRMQPKKV